MNRKIISWAVLCAVVLLSATAVLAQIPDPKQIEFPYVGNRTAVWIVAQLHVLFAAFILGAPIFVSVCEWLGIRSNDPRYDRMAKDITKVSMVMYSLAALTGGFFLFAMITLYPALSAWFFTHMFGLVAIAYPLLFIAETLVLYVYWYTWDILKGDKKRRHFAIGVVLNIMGILILMIGNALTSFMNTPVKSPEGMEMGIREYLENVATLWDKVNNYSWTTMNFHRLIGNAVFGGFIVGLIGAYKYVWAKTDEERAHYDWMGFVGNFFGVGSMMLFPLVGYIHASSFYMYDASLGPYMMGDQLSMFWEMQGLMIGTIFLSSAIYMWLSMRRIILPETYAGVVSRPLVSAVLSGFLPGLGHFYNKKYVAGLFWLVWVPAWAVGVETFLDSMEPMSGPMHFLILLRGFPVIFYIMNVSRGFRSANDEPMARPRLLNFPFWWFARFLVWLDQFSLRNVFGVMKFAIFVLILGNLVWVTPHAFVGAVSELTDETYPKLAIPEQWEFLSLMPAKNTAAALMVLMILVCYILYMRAIKVGRIQWGKIGFPAQLLLVLVAFCATWTMGLMGVVRSGIRKYWHIYNVIPDLTGDNYTPTLGHSAVVITILSLVFYLIVSLAIWTTLKVGEAKGKG